MFKQEDKNKDTSVLSVVKVKAEEVKRCIRSDVRSNLLRKQVLKII